MRLLSLKIGWLSGKKFKYYILGSKSLNSSFIILTFNFLFQFFTYDVVSLYLVMDEFYKEALKEAKKGLKEGGIPIGSVLVFNGQILGQGHNKRVQEGSCVLHGEMDALENAGRQPASVYQNSVIYTTLSPCPMCTGAILLYGIPKVIVGENQNFLGAEDHLRNNGVEVEVIQDPATIQMMRQFIEEKPELWNEDIGVD
ncbi:nucleoside deaminase [Litoribacter populi]|uniref:nucleoside deaminase n=1 Tax=Litoribacter populi TaxID=2598460 RepID=UPI0029392821|nr:nucleoside deaminase [Litoribacter populi]